MPSISIFDSDISDNLRSWLTAKTLGGFSRKSSFQYYDKHLWMPIRWALDTIEKCADNTMDDLELLSCKYVGELFRVQRYNERKRAHVYPLGCYQSWCTENGLEAMTGIGGRVLLIHGHACPEDYAIKTMELMLYLKPEILGPLFSGNHELSRYVRECEVSMPIRKFNVDGLYVVEAEKLSEWRFYGKPIEQKKWFRNNW